MYIVDGWTWITQRSRLYNFNGTIVARQPAIPFFGQYVQVAVAGVRGDDGRYRLAQGEPATGATVICQAKEFLKTFKIGKV